MEWVLFLNNFSQLLPLVGIGIFVSIFVFVIASQLGLMRNLENAMPEMSDAFTKITLTICLVGILILTMAFVGLNSPSGSPVIIEYNGTSPSPDILSPTPSILKIFHLSVYNQGSENTPRTIDWGSFAPYEVKTYNITIVNDGEIAFELSISTRNWNTIMARELLNLTWNAEGKVLNPSEKLDATLRLQVISNRLNAREYTDNIEFKFDIVITATGT